MMPNKETHPMLAREGWLYITISLVAALMTTIVFKWWVFIWFWVIALFVLQFFRDPHRQCPKKEGVIYSPADGKVIYTGVVDDPHLERKAFKISVFMNVFSVHSNRFPCHGTVQKIWYYAGNFLNAALDKASQSNERNAIWVKDKNGEDIVFVQVAGLVARRILCYVDQDDTLSAGERYGYIRFGSRVDLFLPESFATKVALGDQVTAGLSELGYLEDGK